MGFRKLNICSRQIYITPLLDFAIKNVGNKFEISLSKLLLKNQSLESKTGNRSYFCSELIAHAYQKVGIIS